MKTEKEIIAERDKHIELTKMWRKSDVMREHHITFALALDWVLHKKEAHRE